MIATLMSSALPIEPTETEKKVAAADAAQVTANTAQNMADEYKKVAVDAIAADAKPTDETQKISIRDRLDEATDSVIHLLRKINASKS